MFLSRCFGTCLSSTAFIALCPAARAQVVFSNDFETGTAGFVPGGSIVALSQTTLPTDGGGLASPNESMWLGKLGSNVPKSGATDEIVTLTVPGLTTGQLYAAAFDLFLGSSWDGSASGPWGPDAWRFSVDGVSLVNTTFTNGNQGQEYGAYSPQRYSDLTYASLIGPDFGKFTGADSSFTTGGTNYLQHYSIYRFGRGAGNPTLTFVATGPSAVLEFARFGNTTDSADEYWAMDNVQISAVVPEPATLCLFAAGGVGCLGPLARDRKTARTIERYRLSLRA